MLLLPLSLEPIAKLADEKTTRFACACVQVEQLDTGAAVVRATDSIVAIEVTTTPQPADEYPDVPGVDGLREPSPVKALIPAEFWSRTFSAAKKTAKRFTHPILRNVAVVQKNAETVQCVSYDTATGAVNAPTTPVLATKFPDVNAITKDAEKTQPAATFRVDPAALANVLGVLAKLATTADAHGCVTVEVREKTVGGKAYPKALVLRLDNPTPGLEKVTALVMPLVD